MTFRKTLKLSSKLFMLAGAFAACQLYAGTVAINNASFEADVLGLTAFTNDFLTGWTVVAAGPDLAGAYHPNTFTDAIPDGVNTAYLNPGGMFYQDVAALAANTTYTLGVFVGQRTDIPLPSYNIELLDATTSLVLASGIPSAPGAGHFVHFNLMFDSAAFASSVGDPIRIEFSATGTSAVIQINFDEVTMTNSSDSTVPEPRSFGLTLLGLGAIAVVCIAGNKRSTV
jgi:hypothetical protein